MSGSSVLCHRILSRLPRRHSDQASQIVEFAVALPLLIMFVVGIFDFSSAFTLKMKLTAAARDAARSAASLPQNDLGNAFAPGTAPISVYSAYQVVDNYILAQKLNDCGLSSANPTQSGLTWQYSATGNGCPGTGVTVIVNRGYVFPRTGAQPPANCAAQAAGPDVNIVGACVTVQYAYRWQFDRLISLFGLSGSLPGALTTSAVAINEN